MILAPRSTAYLMPDATACAEVLPCASAICTGRMMAPGRDCGPDATVLMINSADDERNPPELGLMDASMQRVPRGRAVWVPASPQTVGHATLGSPRWWKDEMDAELAQL